MELKLKNPIVFFDLETTGINIISDRIVEISYLKIYPNGKEVSTTYLVNPGMPIPAASTAIHNVSVSVFPEQKPHSSHTACLIRLNACELNTIRPHNSHTIKEH